MTTFVALLRGINVGGNNRLPMRDLASILETEGARDVRTYIQSGNAVFESDASATEARALAGRVSEAVHSRFGFGPHVLAIDASELRRVIERNPYPEAVAEPRTLHVFFLDQAPPAPDHAALERLRAASERYAIDGPVCYLHTPDGLGRSKIALGLEKALGAQATARNWNTVTKLAELAGIA